MNNIIKEKQCTKCLIIKEPEEFQKQSSNKDGLKNWCRVCMKKYNGARYAKMPEEDKDEYYNNMLKWRHEHPEDISKYGKTYYNKNKDNS